MQETIEYLKSLRFGRQFTDVSFIYNSAGQIVRVSNLEMHYQSGDCDLIYRVQSKQIVPYDQMIGDQEKDKDCQYFNQKNLLVIETFNQVCALPIKSFYIIVLNGYILDIGTAGDTNVRYSKYRFLVPSFDRSAYFTTRRIDPTVPRTAREEIL